MKLNGKHNLKSFWTRVVLGAGVLALPFAGCDKTKDDNGTKPTPAVKKHNVELTLGIVQHIPMDTLYKYNADPTVDTIFMPLERHDQFNTLQTGSLNRIVDSLRVRHNINPNKIFGKGEMQLSADAVRDRTDLVVFLRDTMLYNVTYDRKKNR